MITHNDLNRSDVDFALEMIEKQFLGMLNLIVVKV